MFSKGRNGQGGPGGSKGGGQGLSFIAADATITGHISASGDLHVDGRIEGDISCRTLIQGPGGVIVGNVSVEQARIGGMVDGSIKAGDLVVLATARATGDVAYQSITIEPGGRIEGRFAHREGEGEGEGAPSLKLIASPG